jgi:polyisoprenyl-phosphate glycosyltransferase
MRVDILIPVYNEAEGVAAFHQQLRQVIDPLAQTFSIYYINDGSSDSTADCLANLANQDPRVSVIEFSRNFGHQAALTAGIDLSEGDFAIMMDGDGEHPPSMIPEMLRLVQSGYDVVLTQRADQLHSPSFKVRTSNLFYRLINRISDTRILPNSPDFRIMSHEAVLALRAMPEYHRFLRGMVAWIGFRTIILPYEQPARLSGRSKYSLRKMLLLALSGIFSFSQAPLYVVISIGIGFLILALLEAVYVLSFWVSGNQASLAPGWSSLMFMLLFVGGSLMICLGMIGIYVGYIFQEVKRRPVYLVRSKSSGGSPGEEKSGEKPLE